MSSPTPPLPAGGDPAATLLAWSRALLTRLRGQPTPRRSAPGSGGPTDPLQEVGRRLRAGREAGGLSLRQLAQQTRISITVLEALEKGWADRLPEPAYLRTMLLLLEQQLRLESGSLAALLPPRPRRTTRFGTESRLRRLSLSSIELFASWQGTALYALLCLLLIYGLNRQQQKLASQGLLSLRPLPPAPAQPQAGARGLSRETHALLAAYPDLWPLERAGGGQAMAQLRLELTLPTRRIAEQATAPSASGSAAGSDGKPSGSPRSAAAAVQREAAGPRP